MTGLWGRPSILLLVFLFVSGLSLAERVSEQDQTAFNQMSEKLMEINRFDDVKIGQRPESAPSGGVNKRDGNPEDSLTTYHANVRQICLNWLSPNYCDRWLPPHVSEHGEKPEDRSPLEEMVWNENLQHSDGQGRPNVIQNGDQLSYGVLDITARGGGSPLDADGKLDYSRIKDMRLKPEAAKKAQQIGARTAERNLKQAAKIKAKKNDTPDGFLPPESLRLMAGRWTQMLRNTLVASLGEAFTAGKPVEFNTDESAHNCDEYLAALQKNMDRFRAEERRDPQANLDIDTRTRSLEERYAMCMKLRQASVYTVNPQPNGQQGSTENEDVDKWRYRASIASLDFVGIDPNTVQKPSDVQFEKGEYTQEMASYDNGATKMELTYKTNAEQLQGYNQVLADAAAGVAAVAARTPWVRDYGKQVLQYVLPIAQAPGDNSVNAVENNGMTRSQKKDLEGTSFAASEFGRDSASDLPMRPVDVSMSKR